MALLQDAIPLLEPIWGPHEQYGNGSLSIGKPQNCTIWIHTRHHDAQWLNYDNPGAKSFIDVISKHVSEFKSSAKFGRSYVYRLQPGCVIPRHRDINDQPYFSIVKRYQFFVQLPAGIVVESKPLPMRDTVFWFDHNVYHYYENKGTEDLIFCVFDVFD